MCVYVLFFQRKKENSSYNKIYEINIKFQHTQDNKQDEWYTGEHEEHTIQKKIKEENPATILYHIYYNSHWYNNITRIFCPKFIFKAILKCVCVCVFIWMPASDYY